MSRRMSKFRVGWLGLGVVSVPVALVAVSVGVFAALRSPAPPVPDAFLPELVRVPAGNMATATADAAPVAGPRGDPSRVVFERPFYIGKFEVTFAQWDYCHQAGACAHRPDDNGWGRGDRPVINVSWDDIAQYVRWLSEATGNHYRLPTEYEWEYAARAGSDEPFEQPQLFTDKRLAWASDYALVPRPTRKTSPVGSDNGNAFGVFGTRGNVWEWTDSCWHRTYAQEGGSVFRENCGIRILQGEHRSFMQTFLREIGSGGCSVKPMPGNFGFRVLLES